jgi:hypothetical protein
MHRRLQVDLQLLCPGLARGSAVAPLLEQLSYPRGSAEQFAEFLATKYDLDITKDEALKLLLE